MHPEVCAVVITYHPDPDLAQFVALLRGVAGAVLLVDNHSAPEELAGLRSLAEQSPVFLIENRENLGMGAALNQAVAWARQHTACEFLLFFDQDSSIAPGFVAELLAAYRRAPEPELVYLVAPSLKNKRTGQVQGPRRYNGVDLAAQTSGSLMPLRIFAMEGLFREDLFIDYVDYEYCLRLASRGYRLVHCPEALLLAQPGSVEQRTVSGFGLITTYNYSPLRQYYLMRNRLWMLRTYAGHFPHWAARTTYGMFREVLHVLMFEQNRLAKLRMWLRGALDALGSRFGRFAER